MNEFTDCRFEGDRAAFSTNALPAGRRRKFLLHLVECRHCVSVLEAIAEDEKLAEGDLDAAENAQVESIVRRARWGIAAFLDFGRPASRWERYRFGAARPTLAEQIQSTLWRPLFVAFSTAAASALCLWLYSRLA